MGAKAFHSKMLSYLEKYQKFLILEKAKGSSVSHTAIIHQFINYIYNHHLISSIDQITVSIANSKFYNDFQRKNNEEISKEEMKVILSNFFFFIAGKYGIHNEKLMTNWQKQKSEKNIFAQI